MNQTHKNTRIAFVKAKWHADIVRCCQEGFFAEIGQRGWPENLIEVFTVPGALEIPLLSHKLAQTGRFAAVVASAFVVDGGIYRHDFVAATVLEGLMRVQLDTGIPVFSAVLTPHNFQEHKPHLEFFGGHFVTKGKECAIACDEVLTLFEGLRTAHQIVEAA